MPEEEMDVRGGGAAYDDRRIERDHNYGSDAEVDSRSDLSWRKAANSASPYKPAYKRPHVAVEGPEDDAGSSGVPSPSDIGAVKRQSIGLSPHRGGQIAPQAAIAGEYY